MPKLLLWVGISESLVDLISFALMADQGSGIGFLLQNPADHGCIPEVLFQDFLLIPRHLFPNQLQLHFCRGLMVLFVQHPGDCFEAHAADIAGIDQANRVCRLRDNNNAERYDRMIAKREEQIAQAKKRIAELENIGQVIRSRQAKLRKDIGLIDDILADGNLTEAHLRLLVERIYVYENEEGLSLDIHIKAPFQNHTDSYENGVLTSSEIEELIGVNT